MKTQFSIVACTITALFSAVDMANAQAPSSIAGNGFLLGITNGTYPFASYGYTLFLPANSGNTYQSPGIYGVSSGVSVGTYTYIRTSSSTATLNLNDSVDGLLTATVDFETSDSGSYYGTAPSYPGAHQAGVFNYASGSAPTSIAGKTVLVTAYDGLYPFGSSGSLAFYTAPSGSTFTTSEGGSGSYSYSLANRSTGKLVINDTRAGVYTVYVGFTDPLNGGYALTQPSTGGFQVGTFVIPDTTRPTVSITNPPSARTYTNAQTVTISATASDNVGVVRVEFYEGSTNRSTDVTPPFSHDWCFDASNNGAHDWTARAYDAAGNAATSGPVTLTVSIDITQPTVGITSPANGANVTTAARTVTGTASDPGLPSSGLSRVEVRVNGGSWSNATGTASWTRSVTFSPCGNAIEARSLDRAGNYSAIASNFVTYTPANTVPATPSNVAPAAGAKDVSVTPTLQAGAFSDPDPVCLGDTHAASQWQVLNRPGTVVVADSGTNTVNKVSWTVPAGKLYYGSNYQWQVRFRDSRNGWSSYSTRTFFTNGGPSLTVTKQAMNLVFNWPTNTTGFALQWSTNLGFVNWSNTTLSPVIVNGQYAVTNNMTNNFRFYRLKK